MGLTSSVALDHLVYDVPMSTGTGPIRIFELEKWCNDAATKHIEARTRLEKLFLDAEERLICSQRQNVGENSSSSTNFCCHQHLIEYYQRVAQNAKHNDKKKFCPSS